ncbi:T9SS type A sorting domain-containing protein [Flavobacterium sp.]|uniref:T9SS type A sorting domain-containing protein n=1 Tax=Flavobacterium sp. TaxID=239 RepID=UPI003752E956
MKKIILFLFISLFYISLSAQCWQSVSAGGSHTLGIRTGGTLWAWGRNNFGQLGTTGVPASFSNIPIQVGTGSNWQIISAGNSHNVAIKTDGTLWTWGRNQESQLGDGSTTNSNIPIQIGTATNWRFISAGDEYVTAIKLDGTLWAWGFNASGQLGDNTTVNKTLPTQIGTDTNWLTVSAGTDHTLGLKTNGTLWAWGLNNTGQLGDNTTVNKLTPTQIGVDTNWQNTMAGRVHSVATKSDGSLWTWGNNPNGQLGDGTIVGKIVPVNIATVINCNWIAKGHQHTIAKKSDGTLWSWGGNASGQLGDASTTQKNSPVAVSGLATDWLTVNSKLSHTAGLKNDGSLYVWGANLYGQLGDASTVAKDIPTLITCPFLSVDENVFAEKLAVYPNPASSILNIQGNNNIVFNKILITDLYGKIVFEKKENITQINIENLASGLYIIQAFSDEGRYENKFIKN